KLALSFWALPGATNRFFWEKDAARALFNFGRWIFVSTLLSFVVSQSDKLVFGKLIDIKLLGVYSIGGMIATLPSGALASMCGQVTFALYSRVLQRGDDLAPTFRRVRFLVMLAAGIAAAGLIAGGPSLIHLMYDKRYDEAGWIVQILSVGAF